MTDELNSPGSPIHDDEAPNSPVEEDEHDEEHSEVESEAGSEGGAKKKKRKKKKKKKVAGDEGEAQPGPDPATRRAADRRFSAAVDALAANSEDALWVRLDETLVTDAKAEKLCEALAKNTHALSLDLSNNSIGDVGAAALAAALTSGAAPDLIELRLLDNPGIGESGLAALRELAAVRKTLRVEVGSSAPPPPPPPPPPQQPQSQQTAVNGGGSALGDSDIVRKYFQVGNDDEEDDEGSGSGGGDVYGVSDDLDQEGGAALDPEQLSALLWDQVLEAMDADRPHFAAVSDPLRAVAEQVEAEMNSCALPMLEDTTLADLKPFTASALRHLPTLAPLLEVAPEPCVTQFSKDNPVPRVGTHRAAVAELVAQLLRAECPAVGAAVAAAGVLPRCVELALDHPTCSPVQCAALRSLRAALAPGCGPLAMWRPLVEGGLPGRVAAVASAAHGVSVGLRPAHTGFAVAVAELLCVAAMGDAPGGPPPPSDSAEAVAEGDAAAPATEEPETPSADAEQRPAAAKKPMEDLAPWQRDLAAALATEAAWEPFTAEDGPLAALLTAQQAELGGPRPQRAGSGSDMDAELAALGGSGQMISGQELLALLRGLSFGRMS